jgi:hypothetical protein
MNGRIWIYNANRRLSSNEMQEISQRMQNFIQNWKAHGKDLDASFEWVEHQILILKVNEEQHPATGCAIDTWMEFLQGINKHYNLDLFKRDRMAIQTNDRVVFLDMSQLSEAYENNIISDDSLLLDHTISKLSDFQNFKKPIRVSWLCKKLPTQTT